MKIALILLMCSAVYAAPSVQDEELPNGRIVGGEDTDISIIPHQVYLSIETSDGTSMCGGSIINLNTVLTAAHCTVEDDIYLPASNVLIYAGYTIRASGTSKVASMIHNHPGYRSGFHLDDIAVIKVAENFAFSHFIRAVNLPQRGHLIPENTMLTVSGWGALEYEGPDSEILQSVPVHSWTNTRCAQALPEETINDQHLCAGEVGRDSCQGDSGGPLTQFVGESRALLVGVVSFGDGCGGPTPGVYARVSHYLDWIEPLM